MKQESYTPLSNYFRTKIRKRDGRLAEFKPEKIAEALYKALAATGHDDPQLAAILAVSVVGKLDLESEEAPTVEQVQDLVERTLFEHGLFETLRSYIIYREQHAGLRKTEALFSNLDMVDDYLDLSDWRVKESANSSYSLQGLHQHISTIISSQYWLDRVYTKELGEAHKKGDFHIHDLGYLSVYCVGWDLEDLLLSGFKGVRGKTSSKPARHFRSALGQVVNFFYTMQGEAAGAQAFSSFDTYLAPFIRYDGLEREEVKQALQEFFFNINIPTRVGFQTPFTNITLDLKVPSHMAEQQVIIGGKLQPEIYGDFQEEVDLFNELFAEVMLEGDADGSVFSFPIPTYNITSDFEWDNPAYHNIWEITAKYGIPYFSNFVNSDMKPEDVRSMCCRLRLDKRELQKRGGGLFGANPLTGSVGVVTINLPRIGYRAEDKSEFFSELRRLMEMAKNSLETKRKLIEGFTDRGLFPYTKFYLRNIKQRNGRYWDNHFSTIGLVGMNECCLNFLGVDITEKAGHAFAQQVLDFMRETLAAFQEETGHNYNLEATPAESTCYRLARLDKEQFPAIMVANEAVCRKGAAPYYTNSSQLPVNYTNDLFEALNLQDPLQTRYTGGTVLHAFVGEKQLSAQAVKRFIQKTTQNYKLPYLTLSPTFSICEMHGYVYGEHHSCPKCAEEGRETTCQVFSRIVGYLRPVEQWNQGKQQEFSSRKLFDKALVD